MALARRNAKTPKLDEIRPKTNDKFNLCNLLYFLAILVTPFHIQLFKIKTVTSKVGHWTDER